MTDAKATAPPILEIENLHVSYFTRAGEIPAVIDFSLTVGAGESVGLVGESGCGKSTVAMAIMRYLGRNGDIVGGRIRFKGQDLASLSEAEIRRLRGAEIAMIYQEPMSALNPSMTIASQLCEVPRIHEGVSRAEARARATQLLADVRLPDPARVMAAYPHQLSGGQQQRVVIAMALLSNPSLLLLDEPTTALDVTVEAGIVNLIADLSAKYGTTMLYISHNLGLILETCDRVAVMYSGETVEEGPIARVFDAPRHPYTNGLFCCIPLPSTDKTARPLLPIPGQLPLPHERPTGCNFGPRCEHFEPSTCDREEIAMTVVSEDADGGHRARCARWREITFGGASDDATEPAAPAAAEAVLQVEQLQKYYPIHDRSIGALISRRGVRYLKANEALSFSACRNETVAIVGESGCGKSTFAKVLMGLEAATGGTIEFQGEDISRRSVRSRPASQIGALQMVFQNPNDTLNPSISVGRHITRAITKLGETDPAKVRARLFELLDQVKLPREFARRKPRQLSGGQKQRVGIARAFAGKPEVVVADEPVSALDVSVQAAVTELLMNIQRECGTTLLFISHDLSVVRYLSDRVVVMYLGQIAESGPTDAVFSPPYHPYTEALLSAVPIADTRVSKRQIVLEGTLPSAVDPPRGCPFHTRCPRKVGALCEDQAPPKQDAGDGHTIACHIPLDELRAVEPVFAVIEEGAA